MRSDDTRVLDIYDEAFAGADRSLQLRRVEISFMESALEANGSRCIDMWNDHGLEPMTVQLFSFTRVGYTRLLLSELINKSSDRHRFA